MVPLKNVIVNFPTKSSPWSWIAHRPLILRFRWPTVFIREHGVWSNEDLTSGTENTRERKNTDPATTDLEPSATNWSSLIWERVKVYSSCAFLNVLWVRLAKSLTHLSVLCPSSVGVRNDKTGILPQTQQTSGVQQSRTSSTLWDAPFPKHRSAQGTRAVAAATVAPVWAARDS